MDTAWCSLRKVVPEVCVLFLSLAGGVGVHSLTFSAGGVGVRSFTFSAGGDGVQSFAFSAGGVRTKRKDRV